MEQKKWNRNDRRPPLRRAQEPSEAAENMLEGRNAVQEALAAGRPIDKLYIAAGETDRALARLAAMAKEAGAAVVETDRRKLDQLSATGAHQGVVAMVAAHAYATVDEILDSPASLNHISSQYAYETFITVSIDKHLHVEYSTDRRIDQSHDSFEYDHTARLDMLGLFQSATSRVVIHRLLDALSFPEHVQLLEKQRPVKCSWLIKVLSSALIPWQMTAVFII